MKHNSVFVMLVLFALGVSIVSCLPQYTPKPAAAAPINQQPVIAPLSPTRTPSPTQDAEMQARATMIFLQATDTAVAAEKTEMANLNMQQTQVQLTYEQSIILTNQAHQTDDVGTALATQTQMAQTAIATITQGAMTAAIADTGTAIAMTQTIEKDKLNAKRVGIWGAVILLILFFSVGGGLGLLFVGTKVYGSWLEQRARNIQNSKIEPDMNGRFPLVPSSALNNDRIVNPNLAHRAVTDLRNDDLSTEQALINAQAQRGLEATRAIATSPALVKRLLASAKQDEASMPEASMDIRKMGGGYLADGKSIVTPAWSLFEGWDGKGGIPFGISERGLEQVSLQLEPHGGVFGKTGSGKSRGFLRPFIAGAIASGQRVVILGKEVDFWPFAEHPNVKMIGVRNITQEDEAARYADYLKRIVEEMNRRDEYLTSHHVETWDKAGRESTLIILDELGNALDMMPTQIRQEAHRWVSGLVREGRKYGFNVWLASQRAVGFKSIVEQLGRAVFYLADAEASRYALGFAGAETLGAGQFFAKFHRTMKCVSFDPTDEELGHFLQGRAVKIHEPISWIEGRVIEEQKAEGRGQTTEEDVDAKIMRLYKELRARDPERASKVSIARIQREVYGRQIPTEFYHVQELIKAYQESQNRTTTGNMDDFGPIPA